MNKNSRKKLSPRRQAEQVVQLDRVEGMVLGWLGDESATRSESIYSLVARNHSVLGARKPEDVVKLLFGTTSGASLQENANELEVFVARTGGTLGSVEKILGTHTLFRFHGMFARRGDLMRISPGRRSDKNMLNFPLALSVAGYQSIHPLKGCPVCRQQDIEEIGMSYWRLIHQYPGVWVCLEHDAPLQLAADRPIGTRQYHWVTPGQQDFAPVHQHLTQAESFSKFKELANLIAALTLDYEAGAIAVAEERLWCQKYARSVNALTPKGLLRTVNIKEVEEFLNSFLRFLKPYSDAPEFADLIECKFLPSDLNECHSLLRRYFNGGSILYPRPWLLLTAWSMLVLRNQGCV